MADIKLKPCPFCGNEASLIHDFFLGISMYNSIIKCNYCGASIESGSAETSEKSDSKVIHLWNKRVGEK